MMWPRAAMRASGSMQGAIGRPCARSAGIGPVSIGGIAWTCLEQAAVSSNAVADYEEVYIDYLLSIY